MATHSSVLALKIPGTGSLVGCCLWGRVESDTTEVTWRQQQQLGTIGKFWSLPGKENYPMKTSPRNLLTYVQIVLQTLAIRIHGQEGVIIATRISGSAQISGHIAKYMWPLFQMQLLTIKWYITCLKGLKGIVLLYQLGLANPEPASRENRKLLVERCWMFSPTLDILE